MQVILLEKVANLGQLHAHLLADLAVRGALHRLPRFDEAGDAAVHRHREGSAPRQQGLAVALDQGDHRRRQSRKGQQTARRAASGPLAGDGLGGRGATTAVAMGAVPLDQLYGAAGELLVARVRLALVGMVTFIPIINVLVSSWMLESYVGLVACLVALGFAVAVWLVVRRGFYRPWLGFLTSAVDVTIVTGALAAFLVFGTPHVAINSRVMFCAGPFRWSPRLPRYAT